MKTTSVEIELPAVNFKIIILIIISKSNGGDKQHFWASELLDHVRFGLSKNIMISLLKKQF
jgi:hypothetical protein